MSAFIDKLPLLLFNAAQDQAQDQRASSNLPRYEKTLA